MFVTDTPHGSFWAGKRVLVTGGAGFIGRFVVQSLLDRGVSQADISIPRSRTCDLRDLDNCRKAVKDQDIVLHLAAPTGGISFSKAHPASQYRDCSLINVHLLQAAAECAVKKVVALGNLLAYPVDAPSPLQEETLWNGPIAGTHLGIGLAKRDLVALAEMHHREFDLSVVNVMSANAYGPGDHFDSSHPHVIPATIVKCFRDEELIVWGDGSPTRDFLYVDDIAEGVLLAAERLEGPAYINLASGSETSIRELVEMIATLTGFQGRIVFDHSKGGGDPRRAASTERARTNLGFLPRVGLREGLSRTVQWYRERMG